MILLLLLVLSASGRAGGLEEARSHSWAGRYEESIAEYRALLSSAPADARLRVELAEVMAWAGRHDEALREVDAALKQEPDYEKAWLVRARALAWSGRHERALAIYDRYPEKTKLERAALVGWMGNKLQSERLLSAILKDEPENVNAHLALADMHSWVDDWSTARRHYEQAVALSSANATAQRGLRRVKEARRPRLSVAPSYFSNSGGLRRAGLEAAVWLRPLDSLSVGPLYGRAAFRQRGRRTIESDSGGLGLRWQRGLRWTVEAEGRGQSYSEGPATAEARARLNVLAAEKTSIWAAYERADVFSAGRDVVGRFDEATLESVRRRIQLDDWSAGAHAEPWRLRLLAEARYAIYRRSDNDRRTALGQALFKAAPWLDAGYQLYYLDARREDPLYFSPDGYASHGFVARLHHDANGLLAEVSNNLFYQPSTRSWGDSPQVALRLRRGPGEASLEAYYLVSDVSSGPRFISRHLVARLSCRF